MELYTSKRDEQIICIHAMKMVQIHLNDLHKLLLSVNVHTRNLLQKKSQEKSNV